MKTVNSISGGQTSAYIAANYKADYNVFSLVTTSEINCLFPDPQLRKMVSDKIGREFIGTLEDNIIIQTIFDLEQFIGSPINWVAGETFDDIIKRKKYLPNVTQRFCTTEMKLKPLFNWWRETIGEPIEMRIGFRANEMNRAKNMIAKTNENGLSTFEGIIGKSKNGTRNKWQTFEWQKPVFPLIDDVIFKDKIIKYWEGKPVRFAFMNNCIGCFHRNEVLLKYMSEKHPEKFNWFVDHEKIRNWKTQLQLFENDFDDCDSGYCGL